MEGYSNAGPLNGTAANAAPVAASTGGRRRSNKKLRLVKKRTVRKMLKKMGLKMRGGDGATGATDEAEAPGTGVAGTEGGRRRRKSGRKSRRHSRKYFGVF